MVWFALIGALAVIFLAVINWKDSTTRRAKFLTKLVFGLWNLFVVLAVQSVITFFQPFEPNVRNMFIVFFLLVLMHCLAAIATIYIPYWKNKSNEEVMRRAINYSIFYCILLAVALAFHIYIVVAHQLVIELP